LLATHVFGRSRPVVFESYGRRRSRWRLPRWLVLLAGGVVAGAAGVVAVQERYLPPRLSASASAALSSALEHAEGERSRLAEELGAARKQVEVALSDKRTRAEELAASRATTDRLRDDLTSVIASLPPDPRGGNVEVRAGRFTARGGLLSYDVVLTRERNTGQPMPGVMQVVVAGQSDRGTESTVALNPVALSVGSREVVRGSQPLPQGFRPRQATVQVLDRVAGKPLGMRVMMVK
jgi:hypothetical protein